MGIFTRLKGIFGGKASPGKHDADAPSGGQLTLGEARLKQQAAVQQMRRGVADVSVSRQRLDVQATDLQQAMDALVALINDKFGEGQ